MIRYKDYMKVLYDAMEGVTERTFLKDRPQAVSEKLKTFCVVDVSNWINNKEIGSDGDFDYYTGVVYISLFVRDKVTPHALNQLDINTMDMVVKKALERFPVVNAEFGVKIVKPRTLVAVSDEDGFHYSLISASLTTYF